MNQRDKQTTGKPATEEQMIGYFTGELSAEERCELEEQCFADDRLFEELQAIEIELTDDYVTGVLKGRRRAKFAQHLQKSRNANVNLEVSRMMTSTRNVLPALRASSAPHKETNSWLQKIKFILLRPKYRWQVGFAALIIAVAVTGSLFFWRQGSRQTNMTLQDAANDQGNGVSANSSLPVSSPALSESARLGNQAQITQPLASPDPNPSLQNGSSQIATTRPKNDKSPATRRLSRKALLQSPSPLFVSMILTPGIERDAGGKTNELRIPSGVGEVRLQLLIETDDYKSYETIIRGVAGQEVWHQKKLLARLTKNGKIVRLQIPAGVLPGGTLLLTLRGKTERGEAEDVLSYVIYVIRR